MSAYELRPATLEDAGIQAMTDLLQQVFPEAQHFTEDVVRWQYRLNPNGKAVGTNAWLGDVLAAHYVTIPLLARVDGTVERGLLSLNTATHPAHQGRKLFTRLAEMTYARAADEGFGFVIGVANGNSTHGFTRKLGFQLVGPLRAMIGFGRLPFTANEVAPRYAPEWSREALAWRLSHPKHRYSVKAEGHARLLLSERTRSGARYVLSAQHELPEIPGLAMERKNMAARIFIGNDPAMAWRGAPYINIPMRLRPTPLNLIFKDLTGRGRTLESGQVRFHALDFDIL